jgi:glycosyltransferase involved in cell wall biosynthesis
LIPFKANGVSEGALPLKLFEYMACEKPVICSRLGGVVQTVGDKVLYASNKGEYQHNLMALLDDRELRNRLGRKGREFVEQGCRWVSISSRLEMLLYEARRVRK